MITVGAFEAKTKFSELLDRVEAGEEIVVTRHGKTVARIVPDAVPNDEAARKARAAEALARIMALREHFRAKGVSFSVEDIISARDEGRR
jgi:prevent-host-death family protein